MLIPWKESYDQPRQHFKKQRHYFTNKSLSSQGYGFSSSHVWMWDFKEIWAPKKDAFELWCWRRLLRVPWTSVRSNQSILKEINPEYSLEGLKLKVTLQYFGQPDAKSWLIWKDLMLGKIEGGRRRGWDGWMASPTLWSWVWASSGSWWWTGKLGVLQSMGSQRVGHTEQLNWTAWLSLDLTSASQLMRGLPWDFLQAKAPVVGIILEAEIVPFKK